MEAGRADKMCIRDSITGIGFVDGVKEGYEYTPAGQVSRTIDGNGNAVQYLSLIHILGKFCPVSKRILLDDRLIPQVVGKLLYHFT